MITTSQLYIDAGSFSLRNLSFSVAKGDYVVLMGRSGSGKTTLLEALCGLRRIESGSIKLNGLEMSQAPPRLRNIGYVPQDRALFHSMTVRGNLVFALEIQGWKPEAIRNREEALAQLLNLTPLMDRSLAGLSGGELQRVALGRALAAHPSILCLDEPLNALDEETREEMYGLLKSVQRQTGVTTLHVTHNQDETERLADTVLMLREGTIQNQTGSTKVT